MFTKLVHKAVAGYSEGADPADVARLDFFQGILDIQQERAEELAKDSSYEPPAPAVLLDAYRAPTAGVFSIAPVSIDEHEFAQTCKRIASHLAEHAGLTDEVAKALASLDWGAFAHRADLARAGADPAAFLEDVLAHVDSYEIPADLHVNVFAMVPSLALRAHLQTPAEVVSRAYEKADDNVRFDETVDCPVCGSPAAASWVGEAAGTDGRGRMQYCAMCGTQWDFDRIRCGVCGTRDQTHLHYKNVVGDPAHRLLLCDECGGYERVVFQEDMKVAPLVMEVEDVVMVNLDQIAHDERYAKDRKDD